MGCGLSDKPQDYTYTLERRIEDVQQLLKHTNVERYNLIVHDWGGAIGMGVAVQNPERVDKIAILNSAAYLSKWMPWRIAFLRIGLLGSFLMRAFNLFAWPAVFMSVCKPLRKDIQKGFLFPIKIGMTVLPWHDLLKISQCLKCIHLITVYWALKKITKFERKTNWRILGRGDFCFNKKFFQRWLEFFPKAISKTFPDAGHYISEDAKEAVFEK